jgi:hypothetical protein
MVQYNGVFALSSGMMKSHGISQITILLSPYCHAEGEIEMPVYHYVGGGPKKSVVHDTVQKATQCHFSHFPECIWETWGMES